MLCPALPDATPCAKWPCTFASADKNMGRSSKNHIGRGSTAAAAAVAGEECEEADEADDGARAMATPRLATLCSVRPPPVTPPRSRWYEVYEFRTEPVYRNYLFP